jgi:hypothetical protein
MFYRVPGSPGESGQAQDCQASSSQTDQRRSPSTLAASIVQQLPVGIDLLTPWVIGNRWSRF